MASQPQRCLCLNPKNLWILPSWQRIILCVIHQVLYNYIKNGKTILAYLGGPNVITKVFKRRRQESQSQRRWAMKAKVSLTEPWAKKQALMHEQHGRKLYLHYMSQPQQTLYSKTPSTWTVQRRQIQRQSIDQWLSGAGKKGGWKLLPNA